MQKAMLHQRLASMLAEKSAVLNKHSKESVAEAEQAGLKAHELEKQIKQLKISASEDGDTADAEIYSAREMLNSAKAFQAQNLKDATTSSTSGNRLTKVGAPQSSPALARLQTGLKRAHELMQSDSEALARAEEQLHRLQGYQGSTDLVSRIAEQARPRA